MNKQNTTSISDLVDSFVSDLTEIIHESALDVVREALGGHLAPSRGRNSRTRGKPSRGAGRTPGRPRKASKAATASKAPSSRDRRTSEELVAIGEVILKHVQENPSQRLEEIGVSLNKSTKEMKRPIANLIASGVLRTEGVKRGTRYFTGGNKKQR